MHRLLRTGMCAACLWMAGARIVTAVQAAEGSQPWNLSYCIQTAWNQHGDALAAAANVDAARAERQSAGSSLFYPVLSANTTRTEGHTGVGAGGGIPRASQSASGWQHGASVSLNLFDGGVQRQAVRQARAGQTAAEATLDSTRQALALQVTDAYLRLLRARHTLEIAGRELQQAQAQKGMVQAKIKAGAAADVDIYPIEVQIASARVNQIGAQNDVRVAGSALRNAMGLEAGATPDVAEIQAEMPAPPPIEECLEQARAQRPEARESLAGIDKGRATLSLARLRILPQFISGGRWDYGLDGTRTNNQWSLNAGLSWAFYDRSDRAQIDSASAGVRATQERHEQLLKNIAAEVEQAHLSAASARERVEAAKASVAMATKNLEAAEAKYKLGLAIPLEIVDAQIAFSNAGLQEIGARYDYYLARAQLDRAVGREVGKW